jgi:hypothetical protein
MVGPGSKTGTKGPYQPELQARFLLVHVSCLLVIVAPAHTCTNRRMLPESMQRWLDQCVYSYIPRGDSLIHPFVSLLYFYNSYVKLVFPVEKASYPPEVATSGSPTAHVSRNKVIKYVGPTTCSSPHLLLLIFIFSRVFFPAEPLPIRFPQRATALLHP